MDFMTPNAYGNPGAVIKDSDIPESIQKKKSEDQGSFEVLSHGHSCLGCLAALEKSMSAVPHVGQPSRAERAFSAPAGETWEIFPTFWEEGKSSVLWPGGACGVIYFVYCVFALDLQSVLVTKPKRNEDIKHAVAEQNKRKTLVISRYDQAKGNMALCFWGDVLWGSSWVLCTLCSHLSRVVTCDI